MLKFIKDICLREFAIHVKNLKTIVCMVIESLIIEVTLLYTGDIEKIVKHSKCNFQKYTKDNKNSKINAIL